MGCSLIAWACSLKYIWYGKQPSIVREPRLRELPRLAPRRGRALLEHAVKREAELQVLVEQPMRREAGPEHPRGVEGLRRARHQRDASAREREVDAIDGTAGTLAPARAVATAGRLDGGTRA